MSDEIMVEGRKTSALGFLTRKPVALPREGWHPAGKQRQDGSIEIWLEKRIYAGGRAGYSDAERTKKQWTWPDWRCRASSERALRRRLRHAARVCDRWNRAAQVHVEQQARAKEQSKNLMQIFKDSTGGGTY